MGGGGDEEDTSRFDHNPLGVVIFHQIMRGFTNQDAKEYKFFQIVTIFSLYVTVLCYRILSQYIVIFLTDK